MHYQEDYWGPDLAWYHNYVKLEVVFDQYGSGSLDMRYSIHGLREDGVARGRVEVEVSLQPFGGGPEVPVTFTMRAPAQPGFYGVRLRGGRDRFYVNERHLGSLDELLDALSGGEHGSDLIATGLGPRVTTVADLMVTGKGFFTVQVVR